MKIAVLVDEQGKTLPYSAGGIIELYAFENDRWHYVRTALLELDEGINISEIRNRIHAVIHEIDDCKVFVVETMKSLPIAIFDGYGITVWNHKGIPTEAFDFIKMQEENKARQPKSCCDKPSCKSTCDSNKGGLVVDIKPEVIGDVKEGYYKIDLARVMKSNSSLNSKQILFPFFQNTTFKKLEILCEHVPKWFEREFEALKLGVKVEETVDGLCHVIVYPN